MKELSTRQLKVGQEIKVILSGIFVRRDIYDPETRQAIDITISEVVVSPDMGSAVVYYIPLGGKDKQRIQEILKPLSGRLKFAIGKQLNLKKVPDLVFRLDDSFEIGQKMENIIKEIK